MTKRVLYTTIMALMLILAGCKQDKDNTTLAPMQYDYAPVSVGHYVIYDVDSIRYNYLAPDTQLIDTIHYQLREFMQDTFRDNLGNISYRIELSKRYDTLTSWNVVNRAWYSTLSRNTYEKNEDDLRFIKLVFPPVDGITWRGNSYLPTSDTNSTTYKAYAGWVYTYSSVNHWSIVNGLTFDSTLVVTEVDNENLIDKKLSRETYAKHVGLIYKEWEIINKQDVASPWTAPYKAVGWRIRQRIHSYGN